jgi:hypothetical protein
MTTRKRNSAAQGRSARYRLLVAAVSLALVMPGVAVRAGGCGSQAENKPVCYYTLRNRVADGERHIEALMDAADFNNEDNLRALAAYFFQKYPEPDALDVSIDSDHAHLAGFTRRWQDPNQIPFAAFLRRDGNAVFQYKPAGAESKIVSLR